ncbi:MAG: ASKHA domain-containing protein [Promethearchaeota archaeon]
MLNIIHKCLGRNIINSLCGGNGKCGKCRVNLTSMSVKDPKLIWEINPPTNVEKHILGDTISGNIRLACQVIPGEIDLKLTILDISEIRDSIFKIQDSFSDFKLNFVFEPRISSHSVLVSAPTLENPQNDFSRLLKGLEGLYKNQLIATDTEILSQMAYLLRENEGRVVAVIDRELNHLIQIQKNKSPLFGAVIDIGTTSIVATLINLESGVILGADSIINPQIKFGRDIMSRLTHALSSTSNQLELQKSVLLGISELLTNLTLTENSSLTNIYEIVIVGNSVMHHLLLNLPVIGLSRAPFVPVTSKTLSFSAKALDKDKTLNLPPHVIITTPPLIGGFIGSDAVVDILYTGFNQKEGTHLLIDFGTNSEIILLNNNNLYAASVAAGGAFEGQHIACGMRGVTGAIEKFKIIDGNYQYQTINSDKPKGICGTGIIDILAQLLLQKQLDFRGQLFSISGEKIKKLILVPPQESLNNQAIYLTRKDVEAIQKAKAATLAAIRTLTSHLAIQMKEIDSVHIAGVFGSNLDINSAKIIGLLPTLDNNRFIIKGNTAEKGGRAFLLSMDARKMASTIATSVKRLELTNFPMFQSYFTEELFFPKSIMNF